MKGQDGARGITREEKMKRESSRLPTDTDFAGTDVVLLTGETFGPFIRKFGNDKVLVMFYAPWYLFLLEIVLHLFLNF